MKHEEMRWAAISGVAPAEGCASLMRRFAKFEEAFEFKAAQKGAFGIQVVYLHLDAKVASPEEIERAEELVEGLAIFIDQDALVAEADDAIWVQGWIRVPKESL